MVSLKLPTGEHPCGSFRKFKQQARASRFLNRDRSTPSRWSMRLLVANWHWQRAAQAPAACQCRLGKGN
jgi:hypothetical protein